MYTELVFFDNTHQSALGTLRGFIATCVIVPIIAAWYCWLRRKVWPQPTFSVSWEAILALALLLLLVVSAIGVQVPNSVQNAAVYGALVGLVVNGCMVLFSVIAGNGGSWYKMLADVAVGVTACTVASVVANVVTGVV